MAGKPAPCRRLFPPPRRFTAAPRGAFTAEFHARVDRGWRGFFARRGIAVGLFTYSRVSRSV